MTKTDLPIMIYDVEAAIEFRKLPPQDEYQLPVIVPFSVGGEWAISVEDENGTKIPYVTAYLTLRDTHILIIVPKDVKKVYVYPVYEEGAASDDDGFRDLDVGDKIVVYKTKYIVININQYESSIGNDADSFILHVREYKEG